MPDRLRITSVNAVFDPSARSPEALLDRYSTLTVWARAVAGAGASVQVVQRSRADARIDRDGVVYRLVADGNGPWLTAAASPRSLVAAVADTTPDIVHVNGLMFPTLVRGLRAAITPAGVLVVQDHAGGSLPRPGGLLAWWRRRRLRSGLAHADAFSFTAAAQADPWRQAGVIGQHTVLDILEASTSIEAAPRDDARAATGLSGSPLIVWVGRLNANKDPLTALSGLEGGLAALPRARVAMIFSDDGLLREVSARIERSAVLRGRVDLVGRVTPDRMALYYGSADIFISASHAEGSGYALIEAMACGLVPVVTDIPSFRAIAGPCGERWAPGDPAALADALRRTGACDTATERARVRRHFDDHLQWRVIGERTVTAYQDLVRHRRMAGRR